jgi:hypothetical protein
MADRLLVIPYAADPTLVTLLKERGIDLPDELGRAATVEHLESVLAREGWLYRSGLVTGAWEAHFLPYGGRWPPIREVSLGPDGTLDFGASPLYGPWHVSRVVAQRFGPRVAVMSSGNAICLVTETTPYDTFHQTMAGRPVPAARSDLQWDHAGSSPDPGNAALLTPFPSPEHALEVALAGGPGHEAAATQVGRALQAFRWAGPPSDPLHLDQSRQTAIVRRLRDYVRDVVVPAPDLVWALGQADGTRGDLAALVDRLQRVNEAKETVAMARVFLR